MTSSKGGQEDMNLSLQSRPSSLPVSIPATLHDGGKEESKENRFLVGCFDDIKLNEQ